MEYIPGDSQCWDINLNRKYQLFKRDRLVFEFKREDLAVAEAVENKLRYRASVFKLFEEYLRAHETLNVVLEIERTYVFLDGGVVVGYSNPKLVSLA